MSQNIATYYQADHDRLEGLFRKYQEWKWKDFSAAQDYFLQFKTGLERHIVWEEEILFPLFERKTGMRDFGPTAVMRLEHQQIKEILEAIHRKAKARKTDCEREEDRLLSLLGQHNMKEENVLYPGIDQLIDSAERDQVFRQMQISPADIPDGCQPIGAIS